MTPMCTKSMKIKNNKNSREAMTAAKNKVFIGLQHENCHLSGGINLWRRGGGNKKSAGGELFQVEEGNEQIFGWSGGLPCKEY